MPEVQIICLFISYNFQTVLSILAFIWKKLYIVKIYWPVNYAYLIMLILNFRPNVGCVRPVYEN